METLQFTTKLRSSEVSVYGEPKLGRDFGYSDFPQYDPKIQDIYFEIRDKLTVTWTADLRIGKEGIFGAEININSIVGEAVLDVWSEETDYDRTIPIEMSINFADSSEDEGWTYQLEFDSSKFGQISINDIEIHLDKREVTINFA